MSAESELIARLCCNARAVNPGTLESVLTLAVEIAREGREGRRIGTIFLVSDHEAVLAGSRPLILDPVAAHPPESRRIFDHDVRETVKELAQLDGGFVVHDDGTLLAAARYFDTASAGVTMPLGLGSRHMAAASVTRGTRAVGVVVSESGVVRLFEGGAMVSEILPELWLLRRHGLIGPDAEDRPRETAGSLTVVSGETG